MAEGIPGLGVGLDKLWAGESELDGQAIIYLQCTYATRMEFSEQEIANGITRA